MLLFGALFILCSHDMFLKMDSFFVEAGQPAKILLYNGTFDQSDNVITRDRMIDVTLVGNGKRQMLDTSMWTEDGNTTVLNFTSGDPGTWVAGVSTRARNIELSAEDFNNYLEHDGVLDMLELRRGNGTIDSNAVEKYSKHVKALFQVGEVKTEDWKTPLGYPIEFVPRSNPYDLYIGDVLEVQLLRDGRPLGNQLVYSGFAGGGHSHSHDEESEGSGDEAHHHDEVETRTDENGLAAIKLNHGGQWYLRTIHMESIDEPGLTHESNWATLTFEVAGDGHGFSDIATMLLTVGGILAFIGLFIFLRKRG